MARDKLKFRDENGEEGNYLTKSRAQLDLEARMEEGYVPDSDVRVRHLNPNPLGDEEYVGTDPIYQNASTEANKPFAAEEGVEKDMLDAFKEEHKVDDDSAVDDPGLGGKAAAADAGTGARTYRTILPGQEGYDLQKAEEQNGPPLRVYNDESAEDSGDGDGSLDVPGINMGATTEGSDPADDSRSKQSGSKTGKE